MPKSACYKCAERQLYCHQHCEKYIEEQKRNAERKAVINKKRKEIIEADLFRVDAKRKRR